MGYFIIGTLIVVVLRLLVSLQKEIFRKTFHIVVIFSSLILLYGFEKWWMTVLASIVFIILIYPILFIGEHIKGFSKLITARNKGELKQSIVIDFIMFTLVISISWGIFDKKYIALAAIFAWGLAMIQLHLLEKYMGNISLRVDTLRKKKSLKGIISMAIITFVPALVILLLKASIPWYASIITASITAVTN